MIYKRILDNKKWIKMTEWLSPIVHIIGWRVVVTHHRKSTIISTNSNFDQIKSVNSGGYAQDPHPPKKIRKWGEGTPILQKNKGIFGSKELFLALFNVFWAIFGSFYALFDSSLNPIPQTPSKTPFLVLVGDWIFASNMGCVWP